MTETIVTETERIIEAYLAMASQLGYRARQMVGCPIEEEAAEYAVAFTESLEGQFTGKGFFMRVPDFRENRAMVYGVEAVRCGSPAMAIRLHEMAIREIREQYRLDPAQP